MKKAPVLIAASVIVACRRLVFYDAISCTIKFTGQGAQASTAHAVLAAGAIVTGTGRDLGARSSGRVRP